METVIISRVSRVGRLSPLKPNSLFGHATCSDSFSSKVIVWVTRKCLTDIFSFPKHLALAEGIDSENPLPMVAGFEADTTLRYGSRWSPALRVGVCRHRLSPIKHDGYEA